MKAQETWEEVGVVGVDAGLLWIGDPCYCVTPDANEHPAPTWQTFCDVLRGTEKNGVAQWNFKRGHAGLGVSIGKFGGDGCYPVEVRRTPRGQIAEVRIRFSVE